MLFEIALSLSHHKPIMVTLHAKSSLTQLAHIAFNKEFEFFDRRKSIKIQLKIVKWSKASIYQLL